MSISRCKEGQEGPFLVLKKGWAKCKTAESRENIPSALPMEALRFLLIILYDPINRPTLKMLRQRSRWTSSKDDIATAEFGTVQPEFGYWPG